MLTIGVWHWGTKYGPEYVERLQRGVTRHLAQPHRFAVFSPEPEYRHLTSIPGCLVRLRMFDPHWQANHDIVPGDRLVCMDLDSVVTGHLDPLFDRDEPFVILQGANASNPCPYNGSLMMLRCGAHPGVWLDFSLEALSRVPFHEFPDDQGWLAHKVPNAGAWRAGAASGVLAFKKPGWPKGDDLPADARLVVFPGWRDPAKFADLPWIKQHWVGA